MFVRRKTYDAARASIAALQAENESLRARVAEVEDDFRGAITHRDKLLAQRRKSLAIRLPGNTHDLYKELARVSKASCLPQSPVDPLHSREESSQLIRALLRQLVAAGEVLDA